MLHYLSCMAMRHILLCISLICCSLFVAAQQLVNSRADSLERKLEMSRSYKDSAQVMMDLSNHWAYTAPEKSMDYAEQLMKLYKGHRDRQGMGVAHYYIACVHMDAGNNKLAETEFTKARHLLEKDTSYNAQHYLARVWHNLGVLLQRQGDTQAYLHILLNKAVPILEAISDTVTLARNYNDIGGVFLNTQQFNKSLSWYKKAIQVLKHFPAYEDLAMAYLGAARSLLFSEDFSAGRAKEIKFYLAEAAGVLRPNPNAQAWIEYYMNEGLYHFQVIKDPNGAIKSYDRGLAIAAKNNDDYPKLELLNRKYYLYDSEKQYKQSRAIAYQLYELVSNYPISKNRLIVLKNLVDAEEKNGNKGEAFELLKRYTKLNDSLQVEQTKLQLNELEKKYQQQQKEKKILQLQTDNKVKSAALKQNKTMTLAISGLLIGIIIVLNLVYMLKVNQHKLKEKQKELEQEQVFFDALIKGQEQERKRLAGDLHDGLGGLLANIKLLISRHNDKDELLAEKTHIVHKLDDAVNELRRIARNLMPETLLRYGLVTALRDYCEDSRTSGVEISLQTYGMEPPCEKGIELMIYRILQELIGNAVKHAAAKTILVQCMQNDEKIFITVEDDGIGYDQAQVDGRLGLGLSTVKNRVAYLKGKMEIQTELNIGTTINIELDDCKAN